MMEKDPYCHTYLAMFRKAEEVVAKLSSNRARGLMLPARAARGFSDNLVKIERLTAPPPTNLVQIQRI
jgi:hypothetical protein